MNPFAEKHKTLTVAQLLEINSNPQNYQPLAIEAAVAELEGRGLNDAELADAAAELKAKADDVKVRAEQKKQGSDRLKNGATTVARNFRPWQPVSSRMGRVILFICIVQAIISAKLLWDGVEHVVFAIRIRHRWPSVTGVLPLFFAIFSFAAACLFMTGKKTGWILLSIYLVFINLVWFTALILYLFFIFRDGFTESRVLVWTGIVIAEAAFTTPCTWFIYKRWMRDLYEIDRFWLVSTICIGILCWITFYIQTWIW